MKSIVILIPYFGKWPYWFDFFLLSCAHNRSIKWLFFTDCGVPERAPANCTFREMSFARYKRLVRAELGINFDPERPYKLCDLKPALGLVHRRDIAGFDFWGFSDIDVVYGDLRAYFTPERLRHQLLSCHGHRVSGHLTLLANNDLINHAFTRVPDWQRLLTGPHVAFDERHFTHVFLRHRSWPKWLRDRVYRNDPYVRVADFNETFSTCPCNVPWIDGSFNFPGAWYWRDGRLTTDISGDREFPYFHFIQWKQGEWSHSTPEQLLRLTLEQAERGFTVSAAGLTPLPAHAPTAAGGLVPAIP